MKRPFILTDLDSICKMPLLFTCAPMSKDSMRRKLCSLVSISSHPSPCPTHIWAFVHTIHSAKNAVSTPWDSRFGPSESSR
jgi:hypothetical protein